MPATVEGVFIIRDRASDTLRKIERNADKADRAVAKLGRSLDMVGERRQVEQINKTDQAMGRLGRSSDTATKSLDRQSRTLDGHNRKMRQTESTMERFGRKMLLIFGGLGKVFGLLKLPLIVAGFASLVPVIAALGAGVVALLPKIAQLGGVLGALPAAFVGMGLAMGTVKLAFSGLKQAMGGNAEALRKLTPEARRFTETLKSWKPLVDQFRRSAQGGLFGGLDASLERLKSAAPVVNRLLAMMGNRLGQLAREASGRFTSKGFLADFETIGNQGGRIVSRMGRGLINLVDALRHVAVAAKPFTDWLSRTVLGWTKLALAAARTGRETGRLGAYFARTRTALEQFGRIAGNLWTILVGIGRAATPLGNSLYDSAEKATRGWKMFFQSVGGQVAARRFFDSTRDTLRETFGLAGDLTRALGRMSAGGQSSAAGMVHGLRELVPSLERILTSLAAAFGPPMIAALNAFARTLELLGGNAVGPLALMLRLVTGILTIVNGLVSRVPILGTIIVAAFAVGPLLRAAAAIRGIAVSWGLVAASASEAAAAEGAASMMGGGGGGPGLLGRLFGRGGKGVTVAEDVAGATRGNPRYAAAGTKAGAALLTGSRLGRVAGGAARGIGKFAWPIAAVMAGMDAYGARRTGSVGNQIAQSGSAALSGASLGIIPQYSGLSAADRRATATQSYFSSPGAVQTATRYVRNPNARHGTMVGGSNVPVMSQSFQQQFAGLTGGAADTVGAQKTVLGGLYGLQASAQERVAKGGSSPAAVAALAGLQQEITYRREILATTLAQEKAQSKEKANKALGSLGAGFDAIAGPADTKGKFKDPKKARTGLAALQKETLRQMDLLGPEGARKLGKATLSWVAQQEKANPALKGAAERIRTGILGKFEALHIDIKKVNGKILDGTTQKWDQIKTAMKKPAEVMKQDVSKAFTDIQLQAVGALQAMGYTAAQAKAFVASVDATGKAPTPGKTAKSSTATSSNDRAKGGRIKGAGLGDSVPINGLAAPGELIVNRHTERKVDMLLGSRGSLGKITAGESTPHWKEDKNGVMPGFAKGGRVAGKPQSLDLGGPVGSPMMRAIRAANAIDAMHYPYSWGGGHGRLGVPSAGTLHSTGGPIGTGFDCSGAVSAVLGAAGLVSSPMVAASYMNFGVPGYDPKGLSTVASPSHVYMMIGGRAFGTSTANPAGGAGWFPGGIRGGFKVNHVKNPGPAIAAIKRLKGPGAMQGGLPGMAEGAAGASYANGLTMAMNRELKATNGMFSEGGRVPFGGWFGDGGEITAHRPTMIGLGDGGTETATIVKGGKGSGGGHTFVFKVDTIVNHGGDVRREVEAAFESLARTLTTMTISDDSEVLT